MITYKTAQTDQELEGILHLQSKNLKKVLSEKEALSQGFVTVQHDFDLLKKLNNTENHIIAKDGEKVVAYVLSMTKEARPEIPVLFSMFKLFDQHTFKEKTISESNFIIVGQVCVDEDYRGQGIFDHAYKYYKTHHQNKYDFTITEVAKANIRSLKAHHRVGFTNHIYHKDVDTEWIVVLWDWKNC